VFLLLNPLLLAVAALAFALEDLLFLLLGKRRKPQNTSARRDEASIVIPTWNGRHLLAQFLPSVIAAIAARPGSEIIVVDDASTDGTLQFLNERFPQVRVIKADRNAGFAQSANRGVLAARSEIVVLLNNDMRVDTDFLAPLLDPFEDPLVFAVSSQIFFPDPARRREETGLTQTWWRSGRFFAAHRADPDIDIPFPCAYAGGGSSAFHRAKFLELGGFDRLFHPFYYEDTDLGHLAWKRGWKVLYQPRSVAHHQHRGTIGKRFSPRRIRAVLDKNLLLFSWKNIHNWKMLAAHFARALVSPAVSSAFFQLPAALRSRWRARSLAVVSDQEAFRRPRGAWFRDRFEAAHEPVADTLRILFLAPYPIEPPVHGGAVFMRATLHALAKRADIHLLGFIENPEELARQSPLASVCASTQFLLRDFVPPRRPATLVPHAIREFTSAEFDWALHRTVFLKKIDVIQIDYTVLGSYAEPYRCIPCVLFEHDIFFQSLRRSMRARRPSYAFLMEYLRMFRYELQLLRRVARVQVCSAQDARLLLCYAPELRGRIDTDLRAVVDLSQYRFVNGPREAKTMLFIGSFRHQPNVNGLQWFLDRVLPRVLAAEPSSRLIVIGSSASDHLRLPYASPQIEMLGSVPDIRPALERYAVFICPVLSGSGVRVKLLEAFACGIPCVSTPIGAEGLAGASTGVCEIADKPEEFAAAILRLFCDPARAADLAARARSQMYHHDAAAAAVRLEAAYRAELQHRRRALVPISA
jgi:GT2 family glycosyltransferase